MSKKAVLLTNIFMCILFSAIFTLLGQLFGTGGIHFNQFLLPWVFGLALSFLVIQFIPVVQWGFKLAHTVKARPDTFGHYLIMCLAVTIVLSVIMTICMTMFTMSVLGGAPAAASFKNGVSSIPLYLVCAFPVVLIVFKPCQHLALRIAG